MAFERPVTNYILKENVQELILKIAQTQSNKPLTELSKGIVQDHLHDKLSRYKTPDHPPYHEMIENAIRELNEEGGSRIGTIFEFLTEKHKKNLPWAHSLLLKHHLIQLWDSGAITIWNDTYMLSEASLSNSASPSKKNRSMTGWNSNIGMRENRMRKKLAFEAGKRPEETVSSQATKFDVWAPRK